MGDRCVARARLMDVLGPAVHPLRVVRGDPHHHADGERRVVRIFPTPCGVDACERDGPLSHIPAALGLQGLDSAAVKMCNVDMFGRITTVKKEKKEDALRGRGALGVAPGSLLLLPADRRREDQEGQRAQGAQDRRRAAAERVPGPGVLMRWR